MIFKELEFQGVFKVDLEKIEDNRGYFSRTWDKKEFEKHLLQLPEGDSVKAQYQNHGFAQALVQAEFKKFLDEDLINYDPKSSRPIEKKEKVEEEDNNKQRKGVFNE